MTPKQKTELRKMFPHGFILVAACPDGKQIELDHYEPYNPFTKKKIRNDNTQFIEVMTKELLSVGDWDENTQRADVSKLASASEFSPEMEPEITGDKNGIPDDEDGGELVESSSGV